MGLWGDITPAGIFDKYVLGGRVEDWGAEQIEKYHKATTRGEAEQERLRKEAELASKFATGAQEQFRGLGTEATAEREYLRRLARGEDSVSAEQLRQSLQQNIGGQLGMAAGARPGGSAMAARTAAQTAGRLGAGLAGQQATAGLQEQQQSQMALAKMLMEQRRQEQQALGTARGQAIGGFGTGLEVAAKQPTKWEKVIQGVKDVGQTGATFGF